MQIHIIRTLSEMDSLAEEWNKLVKNSASDVPFLRYEFIRPWWETHGGGEWPQAELYIVVARGEGGRLSGIAPLFLTTNRDAEQALMLLGSIEIADYLNIIAPAAELSSFVSALFDHLASPQAPAWQVLDWYNLLDSASVLPVLQEAAAQRGWSFSQEALQHCPHIPLPSDFETYMAGLDGKQRHEIRRKMRRAQSSEVPVRWYIAQDESKLDEEIDNFLNLMALDLQKKRFLSNAMRAQMHKTCWAAHRAGWLQLAFFEAGGVKVAGYLNFDYNNRIWVYNSGINFEYRELSPGWVLLTHLLQWAIENKRELYDFMRGDEDYKYRFGGIDRRVLRVKISR